MKTLLKSLCLLLLVMLTGCVSQKKVLYLQDLEKNDKLEIKGNYDLRFTYDDLIGITITSSTPELVVPFTRQAVSSKDGSSGGVGMEYLVDSQGYIDFPILGRIYVVGKTRMELTAYIKNRLVDEGYIKDPTVLVKLLNFKVSVLGAIGTGILNVESERFTIFDAITQSGDLALTGRRKNVMVLREEDGKRVPYYLDLRSKKVFDSPCFYLKQNDMVYVEPNRTQTRGHNATEFKSFGTWMSFISFIASIITIIFVAD